jgi:hypothetical protein
MDRSMEKTLPRRIRLHLVTSIMTLALWRWRRHWFLLLVTGVGMAAAVMIVCALPLFTGVMQTAGLRSVLRAAPSSSELTLRAPVVGLSTQTLEIINRYAQPPFQDHLKEYLKDPAQFEIQTPEFTIRSLEHSTHETPLQLVGNSIQQTAPHVILSRGRLPRTISENLEIAVTPATAEALHIQVGSVITVEVPFYTTLGAGNLSAESQPPNVQQINLNVVGLFTVKANDPFWHAEDFLPAAQGSAWHYTALVSNQALLATFDHIAAHYNTGWV